jgi:hypothetical protein
MSETEFKGIEIAKISSIFSQYVEYFRQQEAEAKGAQKALLGVAAEINKKLGVINVEEEEKPQEDRNDPESEGSNKQGLRTVQGNNAEPGNSDKSSTAE